MYYPHSHRKRTVTKEGKAGFIAIIHSLLCPKGAWVFTVFEGIYHPLESKNLNQVPGSL
jgi:hypothetical protein